MATVSGVLNPLLPSNSSHGTISVAAFSYQKLSLKETLIDLGVRFILNCPPEDVSTPSRLMFQVEEAHWFYEDFAREQNTNLPSMQFQGFTKHLFEAIPILTTLCESYILAVAEFKEYKRSIPVRGVLVLNDKLDKVLMIRPYKRNIWGFPRGKINKEEDDRVCAVREVYEETGFDASSYLHGNEFCEHTFSGKNFRYYFASGVPESTVFKTRTRKEIDEIKWMPISELKNKNTELKFVLTGPFIRPIEKFVRKRKSLAAKKSKSKPAPDALTQLLDIAATSSAETGPQEVQNESAHQLLAMLKSQPEALVSTPGNNDVLADTPHSSSQTPLVPTLHTSPALDTGATRQSLLSLLEGGSPPAEASQGPQGPQVSTDAEGAKQILSLLKRGAAAELTTSHSSASPEASEHDESDATDAPVTTSSTRPPNSMLQQLVLSRSRNPNWKSSVAPRSRPNMPQTRLLNILNSTPSRQMNLLDLLTPPGAKGSHDRSNTQQKTSSGPKNPLMDLLETPGGIHSGTASQTVTQSTPEPTGASPAIPPPSAAEPDSSTADAVEADSSVATLSTASGDNGSADSTPGVAGDKNELSAPKTADNELFTRHSLLDLLDYRPKSSEQPKKENGIAGMQSKDVGLPMRPSSQGSGRSMGDKYASDSGPESVERSTPIEEHSAGEVDSGSDDGVTPSPSNANPGGSITPFNILMSLLKSQSVLGNKIAGNAAPAEATDHSRDLKMHDAARSVDPRIESDADHKSMPDGRSDETRSMSRTGSLLISESSDRLASSPESESSTHSGSSYHSGSSSHSESSYHPGSSHRSGEYRPRRTDHRERADFSHPAENKLTDGEFWDHRQAGGRSPATRGGNSRGTHPRAGMGRFKQYGQPPSSSDHSNRPLNRASSLSNLEHFEVKLQPPVTLDNESNEFKSLSDLDVLAADDVVYYDYNEPSLVHQSQATTQDSDAPDLSTRIESSVGSQSRQEGRPPLLASLLSEKDTHAPTTSNTKDPQPPTASGASPQLLSLLQGNTSSQPDGASKPSASDASVNVTSEDESSKPSPGFSLLSLLRPQ